MYIILYFKVKVPRPHPNPIKQAVLVDAQQETVDNISTHIECKHTTYLCIMYESMHAFVNVRSSH